MHTRHSRRLYCLQSIVGHNTIYPIFERKVKRIRRAKPQSYHRDVATLDDLLVPRTRDTIEALLFSALQSEGLPVTDWNEGSVARTMMKMFATGLLDRETLVGYITAGGFLDLAAELVDVDGEPIEGWLEMLAAQQYGITRAAATFTRKAITLTCESGAGPYVRSAGQLRAVSQAGNYYLNEDEVTVPDGGSVVANFSCETSGLVIDATGTIDKLVTPLPGLTIIDALAKFSTPVRFWSGTGSIAPSSASASPNPVRTIKVTIVQSGRIDGTAAPVAKFSIDVYANGTVTSAGPYDVTETYAEGDVLLTFTDGAAGTFSFIGGDTWFVSTPGVPTLQTGADKELLSALAQRCRDRWPSLSLIPTEGKYAAWCRQCSVEQALGINRVATSPSITVAGVVNVYVADAAGAAQPDTITALQDYIDKRSVDIERANVTAASSTTITLSGSVYVKRSKKTTAMAQAKVLWNAYLASVPIGGEMPGRLVRVSKLDDILESVGAYNSVGLQINSGGTDVDLVLAADAVPAASADGTDDLDWYEIP